VNLFLRLLESEVDEVQEQAVWGIGNIAGDSPFHRDVVLREGALPKILDLLRRSTRLAMLRNGTWTISNFCRGKPSPPWDVVRDCLPVLARLIYISDEEVLADACWALSYLSDGRNEHIQEVIEAGVSRKMVQLLMHTSFKVQTPALRTVGNIVTGDDIQTQIIINVGALPALLALLCSPKKSIRKEACWTISNITAGNKGQIQSVIENNLIPPLSQLLAKAEFDIKKEAAWAISNATSGGTPQQIRYLVGQGCITPLCELLKATDVRVVHVALEGLENILKAGQLEADDASSQYYGRNTYVHMIERAGGFENLEELEEHANREIYERAVRIIEQYLNGEDAGADGDTPNDEHFEYGGEFN
jgi:importin subunit alpha-1